MLKWSALGLSDMVCFLLQNWQTFRSFGSTSMMADALMLIALAANRTERNTNVATKVLHTRGQKYKRPQGISTTQSHPRPGHPLATKRTKQPRE